MELLTIVSDVKKDIFWSKIAARFFFQPSGITDRTIYNIYFGFYYVRQGKAMGNIVPRMNYIRLEIRHCLIDHTKRGQFIPLFQRVCDQLQGHIKNFFVKTVSPRIIIWISRFLPGSERDTTTGALFHRRRNLKLCRLVSSGSHYSAYSLIRN